VTLSTVEEGARRRNQDLTVKSLILKHLHVSPLNSKILRDFLHNTMIPKDRGLFFFEGRARGLDL
jgi:hypothetical protein